MKRHNGGYRKWMIAIMGGVILTFSGGLANRASAQPAGTQMVPDWENMRPDQLQQMLQNLPPDQQEQMQQTLQIFTPQQLQQMMQNLPPEQRQKSQQMFKQAQIWLQGRLEQQRWDWVRKTLVASGYADSTLQDDVIFFMQAQEKARQPLRTAEKDLTVLLIKPTTPSDDFKTQLADFRDKMKKDDERYRQELASLDEKIKYSTQPRLETLLTVLGVVGQETPTLGGLGTLFPDSPLGVQRGIE